MSKQVKLEFDPKSLSEDQKKELVRKAKNMQLADEIVSLREERHRISKKIRILEGWSSQYRNDRVDIPDIMASDNEFLNEAYREMKNKGSGIAMRKTEENE